MLILMEQDLRGAGGERHYWNNRALGLTAVRIKTCKHAIAGQKYLDKPLASVTLNENAVRESFMTASAALHQRKALFRVILFIAVFAFAADVLDLREELHIFSCPCSSLDNNVTTGITSNVDFVLKPVLLFCSIQRILSVEISFLYLLPYGFRAPPFWS